MQSGAITRPNQLSLATLVGTVHTVQHVKMLRVSKVPEIPGSPFVRQFNEMLVVLAHVVLAHSNYFGGELGTALERRISRAQNALSQVFHTMSCATEPGSLPGRKFCS